MDTRIHDPDSCLLETLIVSNTRTAPLLLPTHLMHLKISTAQALSRMLTKLMRGCGMLCVRIVKLASSGMVHSIRVSVCSQFTNYFFLTSLFDRFFVGGETSTSALQQQDREVANTHRLLRQRYAHVCASAASQTIYPPTLQDRPSSHGPPPHRNRNQPSTRGGATCGMYAHTRISQRGHMVPKTHNSRWSTQLTHVILQFLDFPKYADWHEGFSIVSSKETGDTVEKGDKLDVDAGGFKFNPVVLVRLSVSSVAPCVFLF